MALSADAVQSRLESWISDYCTLWALPELAPEVTLEFSARMTRTLGKAYPERRAVRLAQFMLDESEGLLREILCHEIAHLAVWEMYGPDVRPHGFEWRALMRRAGFQPRARLPANVTRQPQRRRQTARLLWAHSCPRCLWVRMAGRPVREWRCAACYRTGRGGVLNIRRVAK